MPRGIAGADKEKGRQGGFAAAEPPSVFSLSPLLLVSVSTPNTRADHGATLDTFIFPNSVSPPLLVSLSPNHDTQTSPRDSALTGPPADRRAGFGSGKNPALAR